MTDFSKDKIYVEWFLRNKKETKQKECSEEEENQLPRKISPFKKHKKTV